MQFSFEYTRKIFSRRERGFGNSIYFESSALQYASMKTKLELVAMVDRGALTPNEWRETFGLSPVEGGDRPIRRLDTAVVNLTNEVNRLRSMVDALEKGNLKLLEGGGEG